MQRLFTACAEHFRVISDDVSLPLVTFSLKKKEGRTYTECVFHPLSMHSLTCTHARMHARLPTYIVLPNFQGNVICI